MIHTKELPEIFVGRGESRGFNFKQLKKSEKCYLYEVSFSGAVYYEIFKRKVNTLYNIVSYPGSKSFGSNARTTYDFMRALEIFEHYNK